MTGAFNQRRLETAEQEAVAWLSRVDSLDAGEADWLELEVWLQAAPENRDAFDRAELLSAELTAIAPALLRALNARPLAPAPRRPTRSRPEVAARRRWVYATVGLAATLAVAVFVALRQPPPAPAQLYETAKGQSREVALADGTHIELNSGSRISVRLERDARRVEMTEGEATFDVAKDPNRPFLIATADRSIRVVGTEFDVLDSGGRLRVTVRRGIVSVAPVGGDIDKVLLKPGQELDHVVGQEISTVRQVDPEIAFAWRKGNLVYRDQTLDSVVADLNRYFATPLRVVGPAGALRFSGVLRIDTEDAVVRRLQAFLPISVERASDGLTLRVQSAS